jgi:hypothetical protein
MEEIPELIQSDLGAREDGAPSSYGNEGLNSLKVALLKRLEGGLIGIVSLRGLVGEGNEGVCYPLKGRHDYSAHLTWRVPACICH